MLKLQTNSIKVYGEMIHTLEIVSYDCKTHLKCKGTCFCSYGDEDISPYVCGFGNVDNWRYVTDLCHDIDWIELSELLHNWRQHVSCENTVRTGAVTPGPP